MAAMAVTTTHGAQAQVTPDRIKNAAQEPRNWLTNHHSFSASRYSPLDIVNKTNAKSLKLAFAVPIGGASGNEHLQATPIVEDGMMYVTDGWGSVYRIDVRSGRRGVIQWKMDPGTDRAWAGDVACCGVNNRGVGFWKGSIRGSIGGSRVKRAARGGRGT